MEEKSAMVRGRERKELQDKSFRMEHIHTKVGCGRGAIDKNGKW